MRYANLAKRNTLFGAALLGLAILSPGAASAAAITLESAGTTTTRVAIATSGFSFSPLYDYPLLAGGAAGNNNFINGVLTPYAGQMGSFTGANNVTLTMRYSAAISSGMMAGAYSPVGASIATVSITAPTVTGTTGTVAKSTLTVLGQNAFVCVNGNLATVPANAGSIAAGATPTPVLIQANAGLGPVPTAAGGTPLATTVTNLPVGCGDTRQAQVITSNAVAGGPVVDSLIVALNHTLTGATLPTFTLTQGGTARPITSSSLVTPTLPAVLNPAATSAIKLVFTPAAFAAGTNDTASTNFSLTSVAPASAVAYSDVWDATTGKLYVLHSLASPPPVLDGAVPILTAVRRVFTGLDSGAIVLQFSEAVTPSPNAAMSPLVNLMPQIGGAGFSSVPPMGGILPATALQTASGSLASDVLNDNSGASIQVQNQGWGVVGTNSINLPMSDTVNRNAAAVVFDIGYNPPPGGSAFAGDNAQYLNSYSLGSVGIPQSANGFLTDAAKNAVGVKTISPVAVPAPFNAGANGNFHYVSGWTVLNEKGLISDVLVFFSSPIAQLTPSQLNAVASEFSVTLNGELWTPTSATVSGNVLDLSLPLPINPIQQNCGGQFVSCPIPPAFVQMVYNGTPLTSASDATLTVTNLSFNATIAVPQVYPSPSPELLTQTITGQVTSSGVVAPGAVIRAQTAYISSGRQITVARANLPVLAGGSKVVMNDVPLQFSQNLSLPFLQGASGGNSDPYASPKSLLAYLDNAALAGQTSVRGYVNFFVQSGGATLAIPSSQPANSIALQFAQGLSGGASLPPIQSYEIQVATGGSTAGAITGPGGDTNVTGQFVIEKTRPQIVFPESAPHYALADKNGNYRITVGQDSLNTSPNSTTPTFVLVSVLAPGFRYSPTNPSYTTTNRWVLATYADPSLAGYLKFQPDIGTGTATNLPGSNLSSTNNATGANGTTTLNIDLAQISTVLFGVTNNWELIGLPGNIKRNTASLASFQTSLFLMGANPIDGTPVSYWYPTASPNGGGNNQPSNSYSDQAQPGVEAFTLLGNSVKTDFEFNNGAASAFTIGSTFTSGLALAFNTQNAALPGLYGQDPLSAISGNGPYQVRINYPLSPTALPATALPAGWSLITYEGNAPGDPAQLSIAGTPSAPVTMIIRVDDQNSVYFGNSIDNVGTQTWIKGASTQNTLTQLLPGSAYFVFLPTAATAFTYK